MTDFNNSICEALIRVLRGTYPGARLLLSILGAWDTIESTTTNNSDRRASLVALAGSYDLDYVDIGAQMEADIALGATLADWYTHPDTTHPNAAGHAYIADLLKPKLTADYLFGGAAQWTGDLGDYARINANSNDYDDAYQLVNGVNATGETGTGWSTTLTTARTSSTANDTIYYTGTFRSVGLWHTKSGMIAWKIDDGAYTEVNLAENDKLTRWLANMTMAEHTITIKVVSGSPVIRQFVAI